MKCKYLIPVSLLFLLLHENSQAQDAIYRDSVVFMATGSQFKASKWKMLWWGKHWRDEWVEPVEFKVIDLDRTAGGLTPLKMGGGHETKSLRLLGVNGKEYVLRTIDKDLGALVPENFKGSFINDIVNDQVSTAHPFGPPVVSKLSGSAGILHTNPVIVFVPDNNRIREYEKDFANKLCLFEERVSGQGWEGSDLTGNARDIINTEKLLERLKNDNESKVDQKSFLKVRMFDILINDWDRHEDQWVWTEHKQNGKITYQAFARDRDQSFSKTDGVYLYMLSRPWALPLLQNLDDKVGNLVGMTLEARFLDKAFLNELTRADWIEVITALQHSITDSAIKRAVNSLPDAMRNLSGDYLIRKLTIRRDDMMRFGLKYYTILNKQVDITGSDKKEFFTINTFSPDSTEITVQRLTKENVIKDTLFHKIFESSVTRNIYLYGLSGEDQFESKGNIKNSIDVTLIGGLGQDSYQSQPGSAGIKRINVYDNTTNHNTLDKYFKGHFTSDTLLTDYNRTHFINNWYAPLIVPAFNADDGLFLGAGFIYRKQHWGKSPYAWQQAFGASVAFKTGATNFFYSGKFSQFIGQWSLGLHVNYKGPQYVLNYYGYGNETMMLAADNDFYRVRIKQLVISPSLIRNYKNQELKVGIIYERLNLAKNAGKFIEGGSAGINPLVFKPNTFIGGSIQYTIEKKDNAIFTTGGFSFQNALVYKRNVTEGQKAFLNLSSSISVYVPAGPFVFAHRSGVSTNIGDYEFYHANNLGGIDNLRGFNRSRFTGKTAFYQNTEIRCSFGDLKGYVLRGKIGILGFFDDGRVWIDNEHSSKFHTDYGGGVFITPFNATTLNISYASSEEKGILVFTMSFLF